jgi:hypothetical protein
MVEGRGGREKGAPLLVPPIFHPERKPRLRQEAFPPHTRESQRITVLSAIHSRMFCCALW